MRSNIKSTYLYEKSLVATRLSRPLAGVRNFTKTRDREQILEFAIEQASFNVSQALSSESARRSLDAGFARRHYIIRHSRNFLADGFSEILETPISNFQATEVALHINAFYLNLRGAFDNLAWALQFEYDLFPGVDEQSPKRSTIHLFGKRFLEKLENKHSSLAKQVERWVEWSAELKELRDPAAHRIPLYVPPGTVETEEADEEYQRKANVAALPASALGGRSRSEILLEASRLAQYVPLMVVPTQTGEEVLSIPSQVSYDYRRYLSVSRAVLIDLESAS